MAMLARFAGLLLVTTPASGKHFHSFAGPYLVNILGFPRCEAGAMDGSTEIQMRLLHHFNPNRPWEPQIYQANFNYSLPFDDESWARVTVASRSNNQWKQNAFVFTFPRVSCSKFRANLPDFYEALFHRSSKSHGPCLIAPGVYRTAERTRFNATFPNVPIMPYGHWLYRSTTGRPGINVPMACWQVEAKTVPKI